MMFAGKLINSESYILWWVFITLLLSCVNILCEDTLQSTETLKFQKIYYNSNHESIEPCFNEVLEITNDTCQIFDNYTKNFITLYLVNCKLESEKKRTSWCTTWCDGECTDLDNCIDKISECVALNTANNDTLEKFIEYRKASFIDCKMNDLDSKPYNSSYLNKTLLYIIIKNIFQLNMKKLKHDNSLYGVLKNFIFYISANIKKTVANIKRLVFKSSFGSIIGLKYVEKNSTTEVAKPVKLNWKRREVLKILTFYGLCLLNTLFLIMMIGNLIQNYTVILILPILMFIVEYTRIMKYDGKFSEEKNEVFVMIRLIFVLVLLSYVFAIYMLEKISYYVQNLITQFFEKNKKTGKDSTHKFQSNALSSHNSKSAINIESIWNEKDTYNNQYSQKSSRNSTQSLSYDKRNGNELYEIMDDEHSNHNQSIQNTNGGSSSLVNNNGFVNSNGFLKNNKNNSFVKKNQHLNNLIKKTYSVKNSEKYYRKSRNEKPLFIIQEESCDSVDSDIQETFI